MDNKKPEQKKVSNNRNFYNKDTNSAKVVVVANKTTSTLGVKINGKTNN